MSSLARKTDREVEIFKQFIAIANWEIDPDSIEKKEEKHTPDIHFLAIQEGPYAVELVELVNQHEANALGWQGMTQHCLEAAYERLPPTQREEFYQKFGHAHLRFVFVGRPSKSSLHSVLGEVFDELLPLQAGQEVELDSFRSKRVRKLVRSVDVSYGEFNGPIFSVESISGVGDPITEALSAKLAMAYTYETPIDLVAYLDVAAMHPPEIWRGPLLRLTRNQVDLGPFRRVWVVDLRRGKIEYLMP